MNETKTPQPVRVQLRGIARGQSKDDQQAENNPQEQQSNG